MKIKRYAIVWGKSVFREGGPWVRAEDCVRLEQENKRLQEALTKADEMLNRMRPLILRDRAARNAVNCVMNTLPRSAAKDAQVKQAHAMGWNAFIDSKSIDDNPWTMTTDSGWHWDTGYNEAWQKAESDGYESLQRIDVDGVR